MGTPAEWRRRSRDYARALRRVIKQSDHPAPCTIVRLNDHRCRCSPGLFLWGRRLPYEVPIDQFIKPENEGQQRIPQEELAREASVADEGKRLPSPRRPQQTRAKQHQRMQDKEQSVQPLLVGAALFAMHRLVLSHKQTREDAQAYVNTQR